MRPRKKYIYKPYDPAFPKLFSSEKNRLRRFLEEDIIIEHIGSTSVPGLGGKGVIDILVVYPKDKWNIVSDKLKHHGYEYKRKDEARETDRLFFLMNRRIGEFGTHLYHIHLTYPGSLEIKKSLGFRDYLIKHPKKTEEYSEIKKVASGEALKLLTKNEIRDKYAEIKEKFIQAVLKQI